LFGLGRRGNSPCWRRRDENGQAAASAGGLATFALSVPMIFPSASMVRSWVPIPSPMTGYRQFAMQIDYQPYLICIILAFAVATLRSLAGCKARNVVQQIPQPRLVAMTVASCSCILIIPMVFIESYIFRPMFWPKYFLGLSIAYFILFGLMTKAVLNALGVQDWQKWVRLSLYGLLIGLAATPPLGARRLYARGPTAAELLSVNHPAAFVKQSLIEPQLLAGVPVVFQDDGVAELFKHYATVSGLNVRFLEVLNERDSVVIYRKVVANFGREAGQQILIFSNPTVPLDEIACGSSARLTKIGNAELPYMGFIAPVYLLQMAGY